LGGLQLFRRASTVWERFKEGRLVLNKLSLRLLGLFVKRQRDGEREGLRAMNRRDAETERWRDGEMDRWRDRETER